MIDFGQKDVWKGLIVSKDTEHPVLFLLFLVQWDSRTYGNKDEHKQHDTLWNKYQNAIGFVVTTEPAVAKCKRMVDAAADTNLRQGDMIARGFPFKRDRDVALTNFPLVLDPTGGPYVVIPMTFDPRVDGKYYFITCV